MKRIYTVLLIPTIFAACTACSSEQSTSDKVETPSSSEAPPTKKSPGLVLEVPSESGNPSGITPMDIVKGIPANRAERRNPEDPAAKSSVGNSKPDLRKLLRSSSGNIEITELPRVPAAPGDGPRGPDGKVVDAKALLKQLKERQAATASAVPTPQPAPQVAPTPANPPVEVPSVRRLDPSEAPQLPLRSASKEKSE